MFGKILILFLNLTLCIYCWPANSETALTTKSLLVEDSPFIPIPNPYVDYGYQENTRSEEKTTDDGQEVTTSQEVEDSEPVYDPEYSVQNHSPNELVVESMVKDFVDSIVPLETLVAICDLIQTVMEVLEVIFQTFNATIHPMQFWSSNKKYTGCRIYAELENYPY